MLVPAECYKTEIEEQFKRLAYSDKLMWYTGTIDNFTYEIKEEGDKFAFAIVEPYINQHFKMEYELIGYVSFRVDWYCSMAYNFSLIRFRREEKINNLTTHIMTSAILEIIRMVKSFKLHRIDFRCVSGNPARRKYERLLPLFTGKYDISKKTFRDNIRDRQGKYHDTICYELVEPRLTKNN